MQFHRLTSMPACPRNSALRLPHCESEPWTVSSASRRSQPQLVVKNGLQTGRLSGYTLSWKRPPLCQHQLRFDNAVMPEKAAFFYPHHRPLFISGEKSGLGRVSASGERKGPVTAIGGGLKGSLQHWPVVYPPEFEIPRFVAAGY